MPPRRTTTARKPASPAPPSESHPSHPSNLQRSLARNDVEIAALSKLNSALRILRKSIVDEFGEDTLIEIATKTKTKSTQNELLSESNIDDERLKQLSESFNLRMKLRRRLLNRLARRLHRVAYLMDNGDVSPPLPPSYGDEVIRFKMDEDENVRVVTEEEVRLFVEGEERKEKVKREIAERRERRANENLEGNEDWVCTEDTDAALVTSSANSKPSINSGKAHAAKIDLILRGDQEDRSLLNELVEYEPGYDKTTVMDESSADSKVNNTFNPIVNTNDDHEVNEEGEFVVEKSSQTQRINFSMNAYNKRTVPPRERSLEWKRWVKELSAKIPNQVTFEDIGVGGEGVVFDLEKRLEDAKRMRREMMDAGRTESNGKASTLNVFSDDALKEKDGVTEKVLRGKRAIDDIGDETENETSNKETCGKRKLYEEREIGGKTQVGVDDEPECEGKTIVSPHRSSFDDVGVVDETDENEDGENYGGGKSKKSKSGEIDSEMEIESDHLSVEENQANCKVYESPCTGKVLRKKSAEEASETDDNVSIDEAKKPENEDLLNDSSLDDINKPRDEETVKATSRKHTNQEDLIVEVSEAKPAKRHTRTFSLVPVPSFYAQDMRRVHLIQMDLYQSGEMVNLQRRIDKAQAAYDEAFKKSMELQQAKASALTEHQKAVERQQAQLNAMKQNANKTIMRAKQIWENTQREFQQFRRVHGESNFQIRLEAKDALYSLIDRVVVRGSANESTGTKLTRNEIRLASSSKGERQITRSAVANVLGHIVDSVDRRHKEILARHDEFIPPFVDTEHSTIIDPNTKETMAEAFKRVQTQLTQRRAKIDKAFADAEKARAAAWSDVVKYKTMIGDSASSKPKPRSRKSSAGKNIAPVVAREDVRVTAPIAAPAVAQQAVPYQPQVFVPVQPSQPSNPAVQMMVSTPSGLAGVSVSSQRTLMKPVVLQSATGSAFSALKAAGNVPHSVSQVQSEGETKTTQQSKYAYGDRYSLQNVAARKLNDGTVVPVTKPKKLPNGEYARPIGRQRKGMEWDSIRGVWIPEGGRSSVED